MTGTGAVPSPWPFIGKWKEAPVNCAALFVDIRGSSELAGEAFTVARRIRCFLEQTKQIWDRTAAPAPSFVKSVGDGLFCVWEMPERGANRRGDLPKDLIDSVLKLYQELPSALGRAWGEDGIGDGQPVELGMGLAFGEAMRASLGEARDYYGYVVNLAAKLQNLARPRGVVIQRSGNVRRALNGFEDAHGLAAHEFPLAMAPNERVECLTTEEVNELHTWTCLAWPGFGGCQDENMTQGGLNARGITVLTHEGLAGKIDTLQIWPRNGSHKSADRFEFIIDDFDSLQAMSQNRVVQLHRANRDEPLVAPALSGAVEHSGFDFLPIRCGLNALAWHTIRGKVVEKHQTYRETIEYARDNPAFVLGMYDNVGASLPILINAYCPKLGRFTFSNRNENIFEHIYAGLDECQEKLEGRLFRVYERIGNLAHALQTGSVHAVLGGGAWLASVNAADDDIAVGIPSSEQSRGFLWIEGAALLTAAETDAAKLRRFLRGAVLTDAYQGALVNGLSYRSCPVTQSWINKIVSAQKPDGVIPPAVRLVYQDTRAIFKRPNLLEEKILVRTHPALASAWEGAWNKIKDKYADVIGGKLS